MKTVLASLLIVLAAGQISAQQIVASGDKTGLLFPSGKPALETVYDDITNVKEPDGTRTPIYFCRSNKLIGIYNLHDSTFTGCKYEGAYVDEDGIIVIRSGNLLGFVGFDHNTLSYHVIEPMYTELHYFGLQLPASRLSWSASDQPENGILSVKSDSLWGMVSSANGDTIAPLKFRFELEHGDRMPFYISRDRKNQNQILFDPRTQKEYPMNSFSDVYYIPKWNMLIAIDDFIGDPTRSVCIWDINTGAETFHLESPASGIRIEMQSQNIIMIEEEYTETWNKEEKTVFSFYNIPTNTLELSYTGTVNTTMHVYEEGEKLIVSASRLPNTHRKVIGEIRK